MKPHANDKHTDTMNISVFCGASLPRSEQITEAARQLGRAIARGWYQEWGKPAVELKPGVTLAIPEGVKHWHGAAKDSWMQHLTYHANAKPGNSNEWLEPVTDEQYNKVR